MATAPVPGASRHREARDDAQKIMLLTVRGEEFRLGVANLPMREKLALREATGMPIEAFLGGPTKIGEDSVVVLWWLARRASGEAGLSWADAVDQWPEGITAGEIAVDVVDPEGSDDPEA